MKAILIILLLFAALAIVVPLLERYQRPLKLDKGRALAKYIWPLVGIWLVAQLLYVLLH